jgi:hypothetical protein
VVAEALGIERRRLDKLVGYHVVDGVRRERQGVSRAFSPASVVTIAVAIELMERLDMAGSRAFTVAHALVAGGGEHSAGNGITLWVDVRTVERRIAERLADAVATHPPPRRGRPPASRR